MRAVGEWGGFPGTPADSTGRGRSGLLLGDVRLSEGLGVGDRPSDIFTEDVLVGVDRLGDVFLTGLLSWTVTVTGDDRGT